MSKVMHSNFDPGSIYTDSQNISLKFTHAKEGEEAFSFNNRPKKTVKGKKNFLFLDWFFFIFFPEEKKPHLLSLTQLQSQGIMQITRRLKEEERLREWTVESRTNWNISHSAHVSFTIIPYLVPISILLNARIFFIFTCWSSSQRNLEEEEMFFSTQRIKLNWWWNWKAKELLLHSFHPHIWVSQYLWKSGCCCLQLTNFPSPGFSEWNHTRILTFLRLFPP